MKGPEFDVSNYPKANAGPVVEPLGSGVAAVDPTGGGLFGGAGVYQAPDPGPFAPPAFPQQVHIHPPWAIPPGWPPSERSDPELDMRSLIRTGLSAVDALRLLMLCDWRVDRALLVRSVCKRMDMDPVKFARKQTRRR